MKIISNLQIFDLDRSIYIFDKPEDLFKHSIYLYLLLPVLFAPMTYVVGANFGLFGFSQNIGEKHQKNEQKMSEK